MPEDAVPFGEMRRTRPWTDPIDAVLGGEPLDEDLLDVAAIVHDLRSTYLGDEPLRRSPALAAFTDPHLGAGSDVVTPLGELPGDGGPTVVGQASGAKGSGRKRRRVLGAAGGFVGTLAGKVMLGTAVAAAGVGGLHAAHVVDVPALPDSDQPAAEEPAANRGEVSPDTSADGAVDGPDVAAGNREAAEAYTDAVDEWTDCVAAAASSRGDAEQRTTGAFDPADACGDHPQPDEFGMSEPPGRPDAVPGGAEGTPGEARVPDDPGSAGPGDGNSRPPSPPAGAPEGPTPFGEDPSGARGEPGAPASGRP